MHDLIIAYPYNSNHRFNYNKSLKKLEFTIKNCLVKLSLLFSWIQKAVFLKQFCNRKQFPELSPNSLLKQFSEAKPG